MKSFFLTPATAYWNQRHLLANHSPRIRGLVDAVNYPNDLNPWQWAQLMAMVLEYRPDLVLELGRGWGNSTCAFTEAAFILKKEKPIRVVSICIDPSFEDKTVARLYQSGLVDDTWFEPLTCLRENILKHNFFETLSPYARVLLFWDAHGFEVAGCVLGGILPLLLPKEHIVTVHDLSDQRYCDEVHLTYGERPIWQNDPASDSRIILGHINAQVAQAVSIIDFCSRNKIHLESADHTFHEELDAAKQKEMINVLGHSLFSMQGHWFFFSLNQKKGPFTFPVVKDNRL